MTRASWCIAAVAASMLGCSGADDDHRRNDESDATGGQPDGVVAVIGATVHTMRSESPVEQATILVDRGVIVAIGRTVDVPDDAIVIDAAGRTVTPGLLSSATQLGLVEVSSSQDTVDRSESAGTLGASFDIRYGLNFNSTLIPIARADGVTHGVVVPSASAAVPFAGIGALINTGAGRDALEQGGFAMFANLDSQATSASGQSRSAAWIVLRRALSAAQQLQSGRQQPASHSSLDDVLDQADLEALLPVLQGDIPLVIRARRESDIRQAVALGEEYRIRVIIYEANEAWRAADLLAAHDVPVILDPTDNLPRSFDEIGSRLDNAALLHAAGVRLAFYVSRLHMSHNVGLELRQTVGIAVANGLSWHAGLEGMTSGAARIWGIDDHAGALAVGRKADFVVWSGDPLEVTTVPLHVFIDGREASLETRQKMLRDRYHPDQSARRPRAAQDDTANAT